VKTPFPETMEPIRTIKHGNKKILVVDLSGCNESRMIEVISEFRQLLIEEAKPRLVLAILNQKNYLTPKFMRHLETEKRAEVTPYLGKQAIVGLNEVKKTILDGFNSFYDRNMKAFDSIDEALAYLIDPD
jgi:hypothetical protein